MTQVAQVRGRPWVPGCKIIIIMLAIMLDHASHHHASHYHHCLLSWILLKIILPWRFQKCMVPDAKWTSYATTGWCLHGSFPSSVLTMSMQVRQDWETVPGPSHPRRFMDEQGFETGSSRNQSSTRVTAPSSPQMLRMLNQSEVNLIHQHNPLFIWIGYI